MGIPFPQNYNTGRIPAVAHIRTSAIKVDCHRRDFTGSIISVSYTGLCNKVVAEKELPVLQCFAIKTAVAFFERAAKSTVLTGISHRT
jgi:hypothetical protein